MTVTILVGHVLDRLAELPDESAHCCVTSPPYYGLRDYGVAGQVGLEPTPEAYVARMVEVFREVRRVLRNDGTLWVVIGDSYNNFRSQKGPGQAVHGRNKLNGKPSPLSGGRGWSGLKEKDLCGIPWRLAFALQADGWYLRQDIIWAKPNPMPESVTDRCTNAHEYVFMLTKSARYFYDAEAIKEPFATDPKENYPARATILGRGEQLFAEARGSNRDKSGGFPAAGGRNKRSVWRVATVPSSVPHFATYPPALIEPCILAGCPIGGTVLDPFIGVGTTAIVADRFARNCIGIELHPGHAETSEHRACQPGFPLQIVSATPSQKPGPP